jgi:DUF1680 family protein
MPVVPSRGKLAPLPLDAVGLGTGYWAERCGTNSSVTFDHVLRQLQAAGWIDNFDATGEGAGPARSGKEFADSEVYKIIEALAWDRLAHPAERRGRELDSLVRRVLRAQSQDGYLNTMFGVPGRRGRYSDLVWGHELYCAGHFIQAGIAHCRTGRDSELIDSAVACADQLCSEFGRPGDARFCGHPGVEMALVELWRQTGNPRYLDTASNFLGNRGRRSMSDAEFGFDYFQDEVAFRRAPAFAGHVVRALYLAAGACDIATETGDQELLEAVIRQFDLASASQAYVTGGMGARPATESFGRPFELPLEQAYCETCGGVAAAMLAWRLLLATGESRFADAIEHVLYNIVCAGVSKDGKSFFYANPVEVLRSPGASPGAPRGGGDPDRPSPSPRTDTRQSWFQVSCCPTNVARTLALLPGLMVTTSAGAVQIHQYASMELAASPCGSPVRLRVDTDYPWDGRVRIRVEETGGTPWTLTLRIPGWARRGAWLEMDGQRMECVHPSVSVYRAFKRGDQINLELPAAPQWVRPDHRIESVRDRIAVRSGPLVWCVESGPSLSAEDLGALSVDTDSPPSRRPDGKLRAAGRVGAGEAGRPVELALVPYNAHAEASGPAFRVWLPEDSPSVETINAESTIGAPASKDN